MATERDQVDKALDQGRADVEREADRVIDRARTEADEVLADARSKADASHGAPVDGSTGRAGVDRERALADGRLERERAAADGARRAASRASNLARLFPLEREKTDQLLETERARADGALETRDDFLGMVSHDLRDLLNGVAGNAGLLVLDAEASGADSTKRLASAIQRSATRMNRLIGDLVDVASIDAGKLRVEVQPTDTDTVVRETAETWTQTAGAKNITLEVRSHGPLMADVDPDRVLQVLGNLASNAIKFGRAGGTVTMGVSEVDGCARFTVRDDGVGIDRSLLSAIFERFWQVQPGDRRGLGLGLYISRCLVEAHHGRIWAASELGVGTTFTFDIPLRGAERPPAAAS